MKKYIILIIAVITPLLLSAQSKGFDAMAKKLTGKEGYTTVEMSAEMIKIMSSSTQGKDSNKANFEGMEFIKMIISDKQSDTFIVELKQIAESENFKFMTTVNENKQQVVVYSRTVTVGKKGQMSEFLLISSGEKDNVGINILGNIDIKKISKLGVRAGVDKK